jgi:hypothetical protein
MNTIATGGAGRVAVSPAASTGPQGPQGGELRKAFDDFVGQTFYGQMLAALRKTQGKAAYFDGGQAEEVFRAQLDQTLAQRLSDATASQLSGPMFDLFQLQR